MPPQDFLFGLIFLAVVSGIARKAIDAFSRGRGGRRSGKHAAAELSATQDRVRALEAQLLDARRQNDQLQQQLEWHTRLLETQDRLVTQLKAS